MLTKENIKKSIDSLPENPNLDEVIDKIIMLDKVEQGLLDIKKGNTYTTSEVREHLKDFAFET